jgi:hypothetical protein
VRAFRHSNFAGLTVTYDPRSRGLLPSGVTITIEFPPFHSPARARHRHEPIMERWDRAILATFLHRGLHSTTTVRLSTVS